MISPDDRRQNFSMLETASASRESDGLDGAAFLPYRPSGERSSVSSVNLADSLGVAKRHASLRPDTAARVNLFARGNVGLLVNYAAVGVVHGLLQALVYPFLNVYLNMDDYLAYSAERWLALPWLLKFFVAVASDCLPVRGSRRKAYMLIGWGWCLLFSLVIAALPVETPYLQDGAVANGDAASAGGKYVGLFVMVTLGYVVADVAADGMMVEFVHLQPDAMSRTRIVTTVSSVRFLAQFVVMFFAAFMCSSDSYGGSFAWGASVNGMMVLAVLMSAAALGATWFFLAEDTVVQGVPILDAPRALWGLAKQRVVLQLVVYAFVTRICFTYYASTSKAIYEYWAPATALTVSVFASLHAACTAGAAMLLQLVSWLQEMSWRRVVSLAVVASVLITLIIALFTVFNVVRSAALTLIFEQLATVLEALAFFVLLFAATEVAEPGLECASLNLVLAAGNLAAPFAISLSQSVGERFDVYDSEYAADSSHARSQVMLCFVVMFIVRLLNLAALPLLPNHPAAARDAKVLGGKVGRWPVIAVLGVLGFMLFWALLMVFLASFERTACLTVAGGESC